MDSRSTNCHIQSEVSPFKVGKQTMNGHTMKEHGSVGPTLLNVGLRENNEDLNQCEGGADNGDYHTVSRVSKEENNNTGATHSTADFDGGTAIEVSVVIERNINENNQDVSRDPKVIENEFGKDLMDIENHTETIRFIDSETEDTVEEEVEDDATLNAQDEVDGSSDHMAFKPIKAEMTNVTEVNPEGKIAPDGRRKLSAIPPHLPKLTDDVTDTSHADCTSEHEAETKVEVEKRKKATLRINGNVKFCEIESVCYKCTDECRDSTRKRSVKHRDVCKLKQHYIQDLTDQVQGDILLRPLDELIEVNGETLTNRKQKYVMDQFRRIRLNKKNNELTLNIKVRRWERDTDPTEDDPDWIKVLEIEIKLILCPTERPDVIEAQKSRPSGAQWLRRRFRMKRHHKEGWSLSVKEKRESIKKEDALPKGNIAVNQVSSDYEARLAIHGTPDFVSCDSDGLLTSDVIYKHTDDIFTIEPFEGRDLGPKPFSVYVFGCRLYCSKRNGERYFICFKSDDEKSVDDDVNCVDQPDDKITSDSIDSRCFIKRSRGNDTLLQSAVDRDRFIHFDRDSKKFTMKKIGTEQLEKLIDQDPSAETYFDGCWFDIRPHSEQISQNRSFLQSLFCGLLHSRQTEPVRRPHDCRSPRDFRNTCS